MPNPECRDVFTAAAAASAVRRLRATNPFVTVVAHPEGVTAENALALFAGYDVVVTNVVRSVTSSLARLMVSATATAPVSAHAVWSL